MAGYGRDSIFFNNNTSIPVSTVPGAAPLGRQNSESPEKSNRALLNSHLRQEDNQNSVACSLLAVCLGPVMKHELQLSIHIFHCLQEEAQCVSK